ncbi:MAG: circularly permuted type 2 ATP-grasp protein [Alphaproteobacteria bacterium]
MDDKTVDAPQPPISAKPAEPADALIRNYRPDGAAYDELLTPDRVMRPQWQKLIGFLESLDAAALAHRWQRAARMLNENGINFNVFADTEQRIRPWSLDPLPLVIPHEEWRALEAGLLQRARLLNLILKDLYGPQTLLRDGTIPAALVVGNPHFLRACHGIDISGGTYLHFIAFDLARAPDGGWWVLNDSTQAPAGAGFALENRIVVSNTLPELYRDSQVLRHAPFFQAMHRNLVRSAPREDPHIVLLTPGPSRDTYFEHSYLARYLGYSLVEGADLTVRDDRVYLKTLGGLQQVDVIVRHLADDKCDPLELRGDAEGGVVGLVQAVRARNVVVANALGSGLVRCDALMAFMPGLCRKLLDADLMLPNVATWWCGHADAGTFALNNFDRLLVKPTFYNGMPRHNDIEPTVGADFTPDLKALVRARIQSHGYDYVAQELITVSTTPSFSDGHLKPGPFVLRAYVAASGDDFVALPGGLVRVIQSHDTRAAEMSRGGDTKDAWVLSTAPVGMVSLLGGTNGHVALRRTGRDLPSRTADNLYWLGRYAERAESTLRMLRGLVKRLSADSRLASMPVMRRLLDILVKYGQVSPPDAEAAVAGRPESLEQSLSTILYDPQCPNGVHEALRNLQRTASLVRDRLSIDAWITLNRLQHDHGPQTRPGRLEVGAALGALNEQILTLSAFAGMEMENMTRSYGWVFLDMGRRMERAQHMVELLKTTLLPVESDEPGVLDLLLELADSFMTYRSRYLAQPQLAPVLDLILADESNPRSVGFQIAAIERHIESLPGEPDRPGLSRKQRLIKQLRMRLQVADVEQLAKADGRGYRDDLAALLDALATELPSLSERIAHIYFSHAELARPAHLFRAGLRP